MNQEPEKQPGPEPKEEMIKEDVTLIKEEYDNLLSRLKELEALREKFLLSAADFENARKRLAKDKEEFLKFGQENMIRSLLPVLDNFERALSHKSEDPKNLKNIVVGIEMILKQLHEILKNEGLTRVESVGKIFDPHLHEAVGFVHDQGRDHEIVEEVEPGYFLHGRLLRAAKVKVRQPSAEESSDKGC